MATATIDWESRANLHKWINRLLASVIIALIGAGMPIANILSGHAHRIRELEKDFVQLEDDLKEIGGKYGRITYQETDRLLDELRERVFRLEGQMQNHQAGNDD